MSKRFILLDIVHPWNMPESSIDTYCFADVYDTSDLTAKSVERLPYTFFKNMFTDPRYTSIVDNMDFTRAKNGMLGLRPADFSKNIVHKYRTDAEVSYSISNIGVIVDTNNVWTSVITCGKMIIESNDGLDFIKAAISDNVNAPEKAHLSLNGLAHLNKAKFHIANLESYRLQLRSNVPVVLEKVSAWGFPIPYKDSYGDLLFDVGFAENVYLTKEVGKISTSNTEMPQRIASPIRFGPFEAERGYMLKKAELPSNSKFYVPSSSVPFLGTLICKDSSGTDYALSSFWYTMAWNLGYMELGF